MSRSQKKSFVASTGLHLSLLLLVVVVCPAFLSSKQDAVELPPLEFVPVITTDDDKSGGGMRHAPPATAVAEVKPPAPAPVLEKPAPRVLPPPVQPVVHPRVEPKAAPEKVAEPEPIKEAAKPAPAKPSLDSLEPPPRPIHKKPKMELSDFSDVVVHKPSLDAEKRKHQLEKQRRERELQEQQDREEEEYQRQVQLAADARRARARGILADAKEVVQGLSPAGAVTLEGPGDGGVPYGNFLSAVYWVYERDWRPRVPSGAAGGLVASASVTIGRDGAVLEAKLTHSSGDRAVDESVIATLENVRRAAPLPEKSKDNQRTIHIKFKVKPNQSIG